MNLSLGRLTRLVADVSRESDGKLLAAYLGGSQPAFRELVDRHGPLVFGVCHRILRQRQDAEDAFQAVFLVLARRAADVWPRDAVGSWLYGVAYRIALKARTLRSRQRGREHPLEDVAQVCEPSLEPDVAELVVRAVRKLPEVYRAAVVACDLQGLSRQDAARQLNWSEGTLSSRLARARRLLAKRLVKTGVALPAAGLAMVLGTTHPVRAGLPETAMLVTSAAAGVPAPVAALTQGMMPGMFAFKLKVVAAAMLLTCTIGFGAYCAGAGDEPGRQPKPDQVTPSPAKARDQVVAPKQPAKKPVEIEVRGNQLIITSDDKEVLDKLVTLARYSTSFRSDENVFKVIRLKKSVSAEDAAKTITETFNGPQQNQERQGGKTPAAPTVARVLVVAEKSTNSIVVIKSSPLDLLTIEKLLGEHIEAMENIRTQDTAGPLADKALFWCGYVSLVRGEFLNADRYFSELVEMHRESPLRPQALAYAILAKNNATGGAQQPKTFELRLQSIKYSDGKPPEIGFYLDRYYPEFDDHGIPQGKPTAKDLEVLIDGKKGKITDLSPGDKVTVQLSPDNKSIIKIELSLKTMKTRLDALEKEAEALRQRLQQLEKGK